MELLMDGQKRHLDGDYRVWGTFLEHLESQHLAWNRIIQNVYFDGHEFADFRSVTAFKTDLGDLEKIEIVSIDCAEYLRQMLAGAPAHIEQLSNVISDVADNFRQKLPQEANQKLHSVLMGIDVLVNLVRTAGALANWDYSQIKAGERTIEEEVVILGEILQEIISSQEIQDNDALAVTLEQKLAPFMLALNEVFVTMSRLLEQEMKTESTPSSPLPPVTDEHPSSRVASGS